MCLKKCLRIDISSSGNILIDDIKHFIIEDLSNLGWQNCIEGHYCCLWPPAEYGKEIVRESMQPRRIAILKKNSCWIEKHMAFLRENLATGAEAFGSRIDVRIEVCESQRQHDLFRLCRYYWSSPYSEYVGRRIRLLIRDAAIPSKPIVGIAALGSSIIHIPERDEWIGWNKEARTKNLNLCMDAYVLGAMPPYNELLGGKLIAYLLASNEVRAIYKKKYRERLSIINGVKLVDLVCLFTSSLYGRSSQYNRLSYDGTNLYELIGATKGYGSLHLSDGAFNAMQEYLRQKGIMITNRFGDGPNWRMRVIRAACDLIGVDSDMLLCHSFKRNIYAVPLASNFREVLCGAMKKVKYFNYPRKALENYWKKRWLNKRKAFLEQSGRKQDLLSFSPASFNILP